MKIADKTMTEALDKIASCDLVLTNSEEGLVGLYYNSLIHEAPVVLCKYSRYMTFYIRKIAEINGIICFEDKFLAKVLLEETKTGHVIPKMYWCLIAGLYSRINKPKIENNLSFDEKLNNEVYKHIIKYEQKHYRKIQKNYFNNLTSPEKLQIANVQKYCIKEIKKLACSYNFEFSKKNYYSYEATEICLETRLNKYAVDFWWFIMLNKKDEQIYIGTRNLVKIFDFEEAYNAIGFLQVLIKENQEHIINAALTYCKEFAINPKTYDIATSSIKTLLELNYNQNGIEYGCNISGTTVFEVFLRKPAGINNQRMFRICGTYMEFIRDPSAFKKLIAAPKKKYKWNFWCRDYKYNPKVFAVKFQPIT